MAQIILDSNNNLIQGDFDNATINNRTKFKTTTTNATTNVYAVPNGSATSAGFTVTNAADPTNASKLTIATNGSTDTQIISGVNGSGTYLPLSFYTNNALAMQIGTNGQVTVAATANPAFSAYASANQAPITSGAFTKVIFGTEDYDTNNNFASSTFTPTIAGYYQLNTSCMFTSTLVLQRRLIAIYKNGSAYARLIDSSISTPSGENDITSGSIIVYANGSTDYFEVYAYATGTGTLGLSTSTSSNTSRFSGSMIRSA